MNDKEKFLVSGLPDLTVEHVQGAGSYSQRFVCLEEIWKATTHQRANHFTGSFLWKVSDWHFKIEVDSIESKSFQNFCPEAGRVTINSHFNSLSNSYSEIYSSYVKYQFLMLRNPNSTQENNQHTNEQLLNNQGVILVSASFAKIFVGKSRIGKISEARLAWLCVSDKMDRRRGGGNDWRIFRKRDDGWFPISTQSLNFPPTMTSESSIF